MSSRVLGENEGAAELPLSLLLPGNCGEAKKGSGRGSQLWDPLQGEEGLGWRAVCRLPAPPALGPAPQPQEAAPSPCLQSFPRSHSRSQRCRASEAEHSCIFPSGSHSLLTYYLYYYLIGTFLTIDSLFFLHECQFEPHPQ